MGLMPMAYNSALAPGHSPTLFSEDNIAKLEHARILTVSDFVEQYDTLGWRKRRHFSAKAIMDKISSEWLTLIDSGELGDVSPLESLFLNRCTVRGCYNTILHLWNPLFPSAIAKWERDLDCTDLSTEWPEIYARYKTIVRVKLRAFYLRYINRAYLLKGHKAAWTGSADSSCSMCGKAVETTLHVYWECDLVKPLWEKLILLCQDKISKKVDYTRENCLLLGFKKPLLNYVMTICKYHIHLMRLYKVNPSFEALLERIRSTRIADINAYYQLPYLNVGKMFKLWAPLD